MPAGDRPSLPSAVSFGDAALPRRYRTLRPCPPASGNPEAGAAATASRRLRRGVMAMVAPVVLMMLVVMALILELLHLALQVGDRRAVRLGLR